MVQSKKIRSKSFPGNLMDAPWQLSVLLGLVALFALEWVLPNIVAGNLILESIANGISAVAWVFYGLFFLLALVVYASALSSQSNQQKSNAKTSASGKELATSKHSPPSPITAHSAQIEPEPDKAKTATQDTAISSESPGELPNIGEHGEEGDYELPIKPTEWSIEVIKNIKLEKFMGVCLRFYQESGIHSERIAPGLDRGIDILLYQNDTETPTAIVKCATCGTGPIEPRSIRELLGVMTHENIAKAFFVTGGHFSEEAKTIAGCHRITLINGGMLLMMINRLPEEKKHSLLEFATEDDSINHRNIG